MAAVETAAPRPPDDGRTEERPVTPDIQDSVPPGSGDAVPDIQDSVPPGSGDAVPDIQDSVPPEARAGGRHFLERYYECRYLLDVKRPGHDYRLLFHSNGIIVVTLAPSHPLLTTDVAVTGIDFQVTQHTNRLDNAVSGKGKRGAQLLTPPAPLFRAALSDGTTLVVPACARGKLVQLNEQLLTQPQLLKRGATFLALILPKLGTSGDQKQGTLDAAEYRRRRPGVAAGGSSAAAPAPPAQRHPEPAADAAADDGGVCRSSRDFLRDKNCAGDAAPPLGEEVANEES